MYTLHMYIHDDTLCRSIRRTKWNLEGKFEKSLLEGFLLFKIFLIFVGVRGAGTAWQNILSHFNYSVLTLKKLIVWEVQKKRIYLIIVLIYNLDGDNKWDINTYEYITNYNRCFFTLEEAFSDNFNGNFLYFYFCKGWDACRFFLHNQRNTNNCMAFRERLGLTQYLGVHKLCKRCL